MREEDYWGFGMWKFEAGGDVMKGWGMGNRCSGFEARECCFWGCSVRVLEWRGGFGIRVLGVGEGG